MSSADKIKAVKEKEIRENSNGYTPELKEDQSAIIMQNLNCKVAALE